MKQASLIATISMAVLIFAEILGLLIWYLNGGRTILLILRLAAYCGMGYFFYTLYKKQGK